MPKFRRSENTNNSLQLGDCNIKYSWLHLQFPLFARRSALIPRLPLPRLMQAFPKVF